MQNLKHFFHYHKGTTQEKSVKIAASFLMASMLFTYGFSSLWSQAAQERAVFLNNLLAEPSAVRVGVEAASLPRQINQSLLQIKQIQHALPNLPRRERALLTVKVFELLRLHDLAKNCYRAGNVACAQQANQTLQSVMSGPGPLPAIGPGPLPASSGPGPLPANVQSGPGPLPANVQSGPGPLPASGPGPLPADVQSGPGPLPAQE